MSHLHTHVSHAAHVVFRIATSTYRRNLWRGYTHTHNGFWVIIHTHCQSHQKEDDGKWEEHVSLLQEQIGPRVWPSPNLGTQTPLLPTPTQPGQATTNHCPSALWARELNHPHTRRAMRAHAHTPWRKLALAHRDVLHERDIQKPQGFPTQ